MRSLDVVAAIIERDDGYILLAERPPGKHLAGYLEFPGGKVEAGESAATALHRELREELELDVRLTRDLGIFPHRYETFVVCLHVFIVKPISTPHATREVQRFYWLDPINLDLKALAPADHEPWRTYTNLTRGEKS